MDFATIARGVPKGTNVKKALAETEGFDTLFAQRVNHSAWYKKHDIPDGIRSIENKKIPTARTNNKPRSNLVDGSNEVKINIPSKIAKR